MVLEEGFNFPHRVNLRVDAIVFEGGVERPLVLLAVQAANPDITTQTELRGNGPPRINNELSIWVDWTQIETQQRVVRIKIGCRCGEVVLVVFVGEFLEETELKTCLAIP